MEFLEITDDTGNIIMFHIFIPYLDNFIDR